MYNLDPIGHERTHSSIHGGIVQCLSDTRPHTPQLVGWCSLQEGGVRCSLGMVFAAGGWCLLHGDAAGVQVVVRGGTVAYNNILEVRFV